MAEAKCLGGTCHVPEAISKEYADWYKAKNTAGDIAQLGERQLCKLEVTGSIPVVSTKFAKQI